MRARAEAARGRAPVWARTRDIGELAVLVRFGDAAVAIPAARVGRILLPDEVAPAPPVRGVARARVGERVLPAWELGALLGLPEPPAAWLVIAASDEADAPAFALATGPCLAIAPHDPPVRLPGGVLSAPPAAVTGVFPTDAGLRERGLGPLGVRIDPLRLIGGVIGPAALADALRGGR